MSIPCARCERLPINEVCDECERLACEFVDQFRANLEPFVDGIMNAITNGGTRDLTVAEVRAMADAWEAERKAQRN